MNDNRSKPLTPRELECLELLANGYSNFEIGKALGIQPPTVALHLSNARKKLGALTREHAVGLAASRGLVRVVELLRSWQGLKSPLVQTAIMLIIGGPI